MKDIATVLAGLGAVGCWWFVVAYWWTSRGDWIRSAAGRHIMLFTADLGLLLSLIVLARIWPDYPGRQEVTIGAFGLLVVQVWWRVVLLHRAQRL